MSPFPGAAYDHDNEPYWRRFNHELASATNPLRAGISSVAASVDQLAASKGSLDPNGFFYLTSLVMSIPVDSKAQQMFEVVQDAARTKNIELTLPSMFQRLDSNRDGKAIYAFTIPSEIHGVLLSLKNLIWELSDNVMAIRPNYTPRGRENQGFVSKGSEKLMEMGYTPAVRDGVLCVALPDGEVCPVAQYADLSQLVAAGEFGPRPLFTKHVARFSQQQGGSTAAMGSNPRAQPPPPPLSQQQRWWQQQQQQQQQPQQQQWRQQPEQQRQQPPPQQHYIFRQQQQQQQQQRAPPPPPPGYPSQPHSSSQMPPAQQPRFTSRYQSAVDQRQQQQQPHQHKGTHDFEMSTAGYNSAFPPLVSSSVYQSHPPNPLYGPPPAPNQQQQQQQQHPYPGRVTSTTADEDGLHSRRNMPPPGYYGAYGPPSRAPASGLPDQSRGGSAADPRSQQQQQQQQQHTQVVQNQQQPPPHQPRQQQQQQPQPSHPSGSLPPSSTQQVAAPIALNGVPAVAGGGGAPSSMSEPATPAHALIQSNFSELTATANSSAHGPAPMSLGTVHAGRTQGLFGSPVTTPDSLQLRISDPGAAQHSNGEHSGETEQGGQ